MTPNCEKTICQNNAQKLEDVPIARSGQGLVISLAGSEHSSFSLREIMQLPYFKFYIQDWLAGAIQECDHKTKGIFIDLCSLIWKEKGCLSNAQARLCDRFHLDEAEVSQAIKTLLDKEILMQDKAGNIFVSFLTEQHETLEKEHILKVNAGRKGGQASLKQRSTNQNQIQNQIQIQNQNEDKDSIPLNLQTIPEFLTEWNNYLEHRKSKKVKTTARAKELLLKRLSERPSESVNALQECQIRGWTAFRWDWLDKRGGYNAGANANKRRDDKCAGQFTENIRVPIL
jgi:hypothetical protein